MATRNDTFFKRLTDLFRSGPAIRRRVKGTDPASYYDTKLIQGNFGYRAPAPFGFGRENSPFSTLGSYGIMDRMSRYCITGDMLIPTNTEKGYIRIDELAELYKNPNHEKHYTFSYCHKKDEIVLKEIKEAFLTKQDKIVEVHFDNGAVLKCTKDHKIMLRDGSYKEAQFLKENDAVMPFYRKTLKKYKNNNIYRVIYSPSEGWRGEHKIVAEYIRGDKIQPYENLHVHHKNFIGKDNEISNLEIMPAEEHMALHAADARRSSNRKSNYWYEKLLKTPSESLKKQIKRKGKNKAKQKLIRYHDMSQPGFSNPNADKNFTIETILNNWEPNITLHDLCVKCNVHQGKLLTRLRWAGYSCYIDFIRKNYDKNYQKNMPLTKRYNNELPSIQEIYSLYKKGMTQAQILKELKCGAQSTVLVAIRKAGYISWKDFTNRYENNKVVKVVFTNQIEKVYDLTIEGTHNFAVVDPKTMQPCGIIHNSEFCFSGETLVYTVEKGAISIKELAEQFPEGKIFHTYSYDHKNKKTVISTAHHPRVTKEGKKQKLVKITLDDGGEIKTTLDHKFILRSGKHIEAKDLYAGAALMPFNMVKYTGGYHQIYLLNKNENKYGWAKEHTMVAEYFAGRKLKENEVVHHIDFNPENNSIENLKIMSSYEHKRYHSLLNNKNKFNKSNKKHSDWMKENNPVRRNDITYDKIFDVALANNFTLSKVKEILKADGNVIKRRIRDAGFKNWIEFSKAKGELEIIRNASRVLEEMSKEKNITLETIHNIKHKCNTIYEVANIFRTTPNVIRRVLERNNITWAEIKGDLRYKSFSKKGNYNDKTLSYQNICDAYEPSLGRKELAQKLNTTINKIVTRLKNEGYHSWYDWTEQYQNHKVVSVQFLNEEEIVYNVTVDKYHNLAVGDHNKNNSTSLTKPYNMCFVLQSEMEYCLHGDTKIAVPNGYKTIKELSEEYGLEKEFIVYSYDHSKEQIVPAIGRQARLTRHDHAYKVTFNSGKEIIGTSNHRLMKRDGSYCEIGDLKPGDAMMPFKHNLIEENPNWIEELKTNHLIWIKENSYIEQSNITFEKILNWCDYNDYDLHRLLKAFDVNVDIVEKKLKSKGFKDFASFAKAYSSRGKDGDVTFQNICDVYQKGMTHKEIANKLSVSKPTILARLKDGGYNSWSHFTEAYSNHKVVSVEYYGEIPLYDLTVDKYKNFATDTVISHNTPELASALDIYSDETVGSSDQDGHSLHVYSNNINIKRHLDELFFDVLNVEFNLRPWTRNLVKFGDFFLYTEVLPEIGVVNAQPIAVNEIEREEGFDENDPYAVRFKWLTRGNVYLENWQVMHMRILGNDLFLPYGTSILESGRRIWRSLCVSADENVWTQNGYKSIKDIKSGDIVYCYDHTNNKLKTTKVVGCLPMGKQKIVKVKTRHRTIQVTPNHGLLIKNKDEQFEYKKAEDLICSRQGGHRSSLSDKLVLPYIENGVQNFNVELDCTNYMVKLITPHKYNSYGIMNKIENLGCLYSAKNIHSFLKSEKRIPYEDFIKVKKEFNISNENVKYFYKKSKYESSFQNLQFKVTKDFCRFFGFMLGDGWINKERSAVGFALGVYEEQNKRYINLLETLFSKKSDLSKPGKSRGGQVNISSKEAISVLEKLEFITGASNKRIPKWAYKLHPEYKAEIIKGYHDADGSDNDCRITSINKDLLNDVRILAQQCGIETGQIILDRPEREYFCEKFNRKLHCKTSYRLYVNFNKINKETQYEKVTSVEESEEGETFDLQVEDQVHNFVCEGIVSHNTMLEDAMLVYRVVRSPERRVFYIDVANVAPNDIPTYMEATKATLKSHSIIEKGTGRQDFRYNPMPIAWDTPIPLLDGRTITIKDLAAEHENNKENWVYSLQDKTAKIVPGKVVWCDKNYTANKITKVWFDDGTFIKTAPEHPFILRDGSTKRADELEIGQAIMPLYIKNSKKQEGYNIENYPLVYDPNSEAYKFVHRVVANNVLSEQREEVRKQINWDKNNNLIVHHIDGNKSNSDPKNLIWMGNRDHIELHAKHGREILIRYNKSEKHIAETIKRNKQLGLAIKMGNLYNGTELHKSHNEIRRSAQKESWRQNKQLRSKSLTWAIPEECFDIAYKEILSINPKMSRNDFYLKFKTNDNIINVIKNNNANFGRSLETISRTPIERKIKELGYSGYSDFRKNYAGYKNHTITKIETVYEDCDVYCMTVVGPKGEDDRHNFAAQNIGLNKSFVFLRNSIDEDFYIPVRGTQSGTRIDTLAGGQHITAIEDVQYMQSKLFAAIKVPKPYLNYDENLSSKSSLSQMDIRFSRTIGNIQKIIISELNKLAMIHLYAKGFDGEDLVDFELKLSNPSSVAVQQKLELLSTKADVAGTIKDTGLVDERWIQKHILELTDDDIIQINKGLYEDRVKEAQLDSVAFDTELEKNTTTDTFSPTNYQMSGEDIPKVPQTEYSTQNNNDNIKNNSGISVPNQNRENPYKINYKKGSTPIKATPFLTKHKRNRTRRVGNVGSKDNTGASDFSSMLSANNRFFKDVYDMRTLRNPTSEGVDNSKLIRLEPILPNEIKSMLRNLKDHFQRNGQYKKKILTENININIEDKKDDDFILEIVSEKNVIVNDKKPSLKEVMEELDDNKDEIDIDIDIE